MNPDQPVARLITAEEGMQIFQRFIDAEKVLGPLTYEEKVAIAKTFGTEMTLDDVISAIQGQRILVIRHKEQEK